MLIDLNNKHTPQSNKDVKAKLVEQAMELILSDPELTEEELDNLCDWLCKNEFADLRTAAIEKYYATRSFSEENAGARSPEESATVEEVWAKVAKRLNMHPDINHYRALRAERSEEEAKSSSARKLNTIRRMALRVAAVLIPVAFIIGGYLWMNSIPHTTDLPAYMADAAKFVPTDSVSSSQDSLRHITLPDGTQVILNRNSTFTYNSHREGKLEGEAWFEVTKDPERPFIIHSGYMRVQVLGTKFNFRARSEEATSALSLYEGRVRLDYASGSRRLDTGGLEATIDHATDSTHVHPFNPSGRRPEWLAEAEGEESLSRVMSLDEIFRAIESTFDVTFQNTQAVDMTRQYNFRLDRGSSLDEVLSSLIIAGGEFDYIINRNTNTIQISPK